MRRLRRRNPFDPAHAARPDIFRGREDEIGDVAEALSAASYGDPVEHILVTGERGIGKTSLLEICARIAQDDMPGTRTGFDFLVVSISLTGVTDMFQITQRVASAIRDELDRRKVANPGLRSVVQFLLNWEILGVHYHRPDSAVSDDQAMGLLVEQCVRIERTGHFQGILVIMDEADDPPASARLATWCKTFTERFGQAEGARLVLCLAGQVELTAKLRQDHQSALRLFRECTLPVLSRAECEQILRAGIALSNGSSDEKTELRDDAVALLTDLAEGYPYFLQVYARAAFKADRDNVLDGADVQAAQVGATEEIGQKFFRGIYDAVATSDNYRAVLRAMAPFGNRWVGRQEILKAAEGVSEANVNNALRKLRDGAVVELHPDRPGTYRLQTNAFAAWLSTRDAGSSTA
ncbi:orc1/cdc6 family replication initiation protein [Marinibacterium anthonyi]|nr:orc1/cdc6 family replication initiation protein [Marinibacterium anthonyi]